MLHVGLELATSDAADEAAIGAVLEAIAEVGEAVDEELELEILEFLEAVVERYVLELIVVNSAELLPREETDVDEVTIVLVDTVAGAIVSITELLKE